MTSLVYIGPVFLEKKWKCITFMTKTIMTTTTTAVNRKVVSRKPELILAFSSGLREQ